MVVKRSVSIRYFTTLLHSSEVAQLRFACSLCSSKLLKSKAHQCGSITPPVVLTRSVMPRIGSSGLETVVVQLAMLSITKVLRTVMDDWRVETTVSPPHPEVKVPSP